MVPYTQTRHQDMFQRFSVLFKILKKKTKKKKNSIRRKIDARITYPTDGLDMRPYLDGAVRDEVEDTIYDLYAAVLHHGSVNVGHFTAIAKSNGRWFYFDDDLVEEIGLEDVVDYSAYLLFYEKRGQK